MFVGQQQDKVEGDLRPVVIDGSNVAMSHGMDSVFSAKGIELVVKFFTARGHKKVVAFVPQFRSKYNMSTDRKLLEQLYKSGTLVYTPSREVGCTRISSYDDAFILDYAAMHGGVVITRDNYRDLAHVGHIGDYPEKTNELIFRKSQSGWMLLGIGYSCQLLLGTMLCSLVTL